SRMAANEASAVGSIPTINTASATYPTTDPDGGYHIALTQLAPAASATSANADLIDSVLAGGTKSGYTFKMTVGTGASTPQTSYDVSAAPVSTSSGTRYFFSDRKSVVRGNATSTATSTSAPLQ